MESYLLDIFVHANRMTQPAITKKNKMYFFCKCAPPLMAKYRIHKFYWSAGISLCILSHCGTHGRPDQQHFCAGHYGRLMVILPVDSVFSKCPREHKDAGLCQRQRKLGRSQAPPAPAVLPALPAMGSTALSRPNAGANTDNMWPMEGGDPSALCLCADLSWDFALKRSKKKNQNYWVHMT